MKMVILSIKILAIINQDLDHDALFEAYRQIKYLERSINQINISSDKLMKNRQIEIKKKTEQNNSLVTNLNNLKKQNRGNFILVLFLRVEK